MASLQEVAGVLTKLKDVGWIGSGVSVGVFLGGMGSNHPEAYEASSVAIVIGSALIVGGLVSNLDSAPTIFRKKLSPIFLYFGGAFWGVSYGMNMKSQENNIEQFKSGAELAFKIAVGSAGLYGAGRVSEKISGTKQ